MCISKLQKINDRLDCVAFVETSYLNTGTIYFGAWGTVLKSVYSAHQIIRFISQTVLNSFTITPECQSHHWELNLSLHMREFNLSHMPDSLDTNKIKVVHVFDSVYANVAISLAE